MKQVGAFCGGVVWCGISCCCCFYWWCYVLLIYVCTWDWIVQGREKNNVSVSVFLFYLLQTVKQYICLQKVYIHMLIKMTTCLYP